MKYSGPVSFFFEGDKGQAQHWQLVARQVVQQTIDLNGGTPGTRGFMFKFGDVTITTEVEVGEGWTAPKAVIYAPVRKPKPKPLVIVIPYELYVRGSAYVVNDYCVEGRTKVFVAEFSEKGDFLKQYYIGDTLPPEAELTDEEKDEGVFVFSWDNYTKAGPYFVEGTDDLTMGEFATPGATSNCGIKYLPFDFIEKSTPNPGSNNRFNSQIRGSFYSKGKKGESLPTTLSGAVKTAGGLVLIGQLDEGKLSWYKKEDGEWEEKKLDLGDKTLTQLSQAFQFTLDAEGNAIGVGFAGFSSRALYAKARIEVVVDIKGEVTATTQMLFNNWDYEEQEEETTEPVFETAMSMELLDNKVFVEKKNAYGTHVVLAGIPYSWFGHKDAYFGTKYTHDFDATGDYAIAEATDLDKEHSVVKYELAEATMVGGLGPQTISKSFSMSGVYASIVYTEDFSGIELVTVDGWPFIDTSAKTATLISFDSNRESAYVAIFEPQYYSNNYAPITTCSLMAQLLNLPFDYEVTKKAVSGRIHTIYTELATQEKETTYRQVNADISYTYKVNSGDQEIKNELTKDFNLSAPATRFAVDELGLAHYTKLEVDYHPWFSCGIEFTIGCGVYSGYSRFVGLDFSADTHTHTSTQVLIIDIKAVYDPQFGYTGVTPIKQEPPAKQYYAQDITKATMLYTNRNPLDTIKASATDIWCPATKITEHTQDSDWQSWYVFDADPEYSIAVVSQFLYDCYLFDKKIEQIRTEHISIVERYCVVDSAQIFPQEEEKDITGKVVLFYAPESQKRLGRNYYKDHGDFIAGDMVRAPFAPYHSYSLNTPLNSLSASAPYGATIVTQFFGVDHYAQVGICDGRIYSQPSKKLDLALASGGWWMRDAGDNGPNESYGNDLLSNKKPELASKIKAWFDAKYPSNSEQDYRFLGLSFYRPK